MTRCVILLLEVLALLCPIDGAIVRLERLQSIDTRKHANKTRVLIRPRGIAEANNIAYVAVGNEKELLKFDGETFAYLGRDGPSDGFSYVRDIMSLPEGQLFVADRGRAKIYKMMEEGWWSYYKSPFYSFNRMTWFREGGAYKFVMTRMKPKRISIMDEDFHLEREIDISHLPRMNEETSPGKRVGVWQAMKIDNTGYILSYSTLGVFSYLAMIDNTGKLLKIVKDSDKPLKDGKGFNDIKEFVKDKHGYYHCALESDSKVVTFDKDLKYVTELYLSGSKLLSRLSYDEYLDRLLVAHLNGFDSIRIHYD